MFNKTSCGSKKKIRMNETPTKSHTASIHLKTQEDLGSDGYRLPLKELLTQRRDDDYKDFKEYNQVSLKKIRQQQLKYQGLGVLATTRVKESSRSAKKISVQEMQGRGTLGTDRSSKEHIGSIGSKRLRTEADNVESNDNSYMKLIQQYAEENCRLKQEIKRKKDCVQIRAEDLVALISQYSKLKAKNQSMQKELDFFKSETANQQYVSNSIFKVLSQ